MVAFRSSLLPSYALSSLVAECNSHTCVRDRDTVRQIMLTSVVRTALVGILLG